MDEKLKEMIAIGASVTANCIPCIQHHFARAREIGVTNAEIKAAVLIGRAVRKGAAQKWDEEVGSLFSASPTKQKNSCGCA